VPTFPRDALGQESESFGSLFRLLPRSVNSAATAPIAPAMPAAIPLRLAIVAARLGVDGAGAGFAAAGFEAGFGAAALGVAWGFGLAGFAAVFGFAAALAGAFDAATGLVSASGLGAAVWGFAAAFGFAAALGLAAAFAAAGLAGVFLGVVAMRDNPLFSLLANARAYQIVSAS
jgi:hypothetical protein